MKNRFFNFSYIFMMFLLGSSVFFFSCSKDSGTDPNEGKIDPATVATTNLVAYFPFESDGVDKISALTPKQMPNVTYVLGKRGNAYQGASNGYYLYDLPAASKLKTLKAFTISMWFYGRPAIDGVAPVPGIIQISGTSEPTWGNLMITQDRMPDVVDSLNIKMVYHKEGAVWANQFVGFSKPAFLENKWIHLVFAYDNVTSKYMVYVNGAALTLDAGITNRWAAGDDVSPRPGLGDLVFNNATQMAIGGWIQRILGASQDEWMGYFTGRIDELRIYDKGLNTTEVTALYNAEITQLNP